MQGSSTFCRNALLRITMVNSLLNPFIFSHEENCSLEFWPVAKVLHQINCRNDKQCIISTDIQVTVLILQCKCMFQILWVGRNVHIDRSPLSKHCAKTREVEVCQPAYFHPQCLDLGRSPTYYAYPYPSCYQVGVLVSLPTNPKQGHISPWDYFSLLINISNKGKASVTQLSTLVTSSPKF